MVETINQKIVKARKEHKCSWCHGVIKIGEEYESATCKSADHGIYIWKNHRHCKELADGLDMWMHGWDGLNDDEFAECVQDYLQENNWFTGEYAHEDFQDWVDDNNRDSMTLKAYEIYKKNKNMVPINSKNLKLNHIALMSNGSHEAGFTLEYPSIFPKVAEYIGRYIGHKYEIKKADKEETGVEFIVTFDNHPGLTGSGDTVEEALIMAKEGLDMWLEVEKEENE